MRLLDRNKRTFYYAEYSTKAMQTDSQGNYTGEFGITYGTPIAVKAYVGATKGSWTISSGATIDQFGLDVDYDKVIQLEGTNWSIKEDTVLWVDDLDTTNPYDYIVKRVAVYLDHIALAIKKVR